MIEIDLFNASPFKWEDLWGDQSTLIATAFDAWGCVVWFGGQWHGIGGSKEGVKLLASGADRMLAIAASDDFIRNVESTEAASKSARWLHTPPSDKQLEHLDFSRADVIARKLTRYQAACHLTWKFNNRGIRSKLEAASRRIAA